MNDLLQQRFFRLLSECSQRKVSIIENDEFNQWMQKLYVKLEEVGKEFNVTRERIRQIEAKALRKLRHPSRSRKLKDYLD